MRKPMAVLLSSGALLAVAAFSILGPNAPWRPALAGGDDDDDHRRRCRLEGSWVGTNSAGTHFGQTLIAGPGEKTLTFHLGGINGDATVGGLFPNARQSEAGVLGEAWRVGRNTYDFKAIDYYVQDVEVDGLKQQEIVYIQTFTGTAVFFDCELEEAVADASFFMPEQDADGDGFPDPGEEPFIFAPGAEFVLRRLP